MGYAADEVSVRGGKPNELYKFEGTYSTYCYTSGPQQIRYPDEEGGDIYIPIAIQRSAIQAGTQEDDKLDMTITIAVTHQLVTDYGFQDTPPSLQLTVFRYHTIDDVIPYWYGPVDNIKVTGGKASIRSYSKLGAALAQAFPNVYYQSPCNHTLYDSRCGVNYGDHSAEFEVEDVNGRAILLTSMDPDLDTQLVGGEVVLASGERRMISQQLGPLVTVNFPFYGLQVGDTITLAKGCNLAYRGDCKTKFANQLHFGGFPFIPTDNPFTDGIEPGNMLDDGTCLPPTQIECVFHWDLNFNGCNTGYCPTRNYNLGPIANRAPGYTNVVNPPLAPGGPSGKSIGSLLAWNGAPCDATGEIYEHNYYNDPESEWYRNPLASKLRGQLIASYVFTRGDFTVSIFGANLEGGGALTVQYGSFWCGDNVADGTLRRTNCYGVDTGCSTATLVGPHGLVGNAVYNWFW